MEEKCALAATTPKMMSSAFSVSRDQPGEHATAKLAPGPVSQSVNRLAGRSRHPPYHRPSWTAPTPLYTFVALCPHISHSYTTQETLSSVTRSAPLFSIFRYRNSPPSVAVQISSLITHYLYSTVKWSTVPKRTHITLYFNTRNTCQPFQFSTRLNHFSYKLCRPAYFIYPPPPPAFTGQPQYQHVMQWSVVFQPSSQIEDRTKQHAAASILFQTCGSCAPTVSPIFQSALPQHTPRPVLV